MSDLHCQDSLKHQTRINRQRLLPCQVWKLLLSQWVSRNYKMRVEGLSANKTLHFSVIMEIFQVAPPFIMVDIQKAAGDAEEYLKFYENFCNNLDDIIWRPPDETGKSRITKTKSKRR
ncbi:CBL-interacting serine/threonine-protein kinase 8-like [Salvia splendens]|uniref:CBL-interacting serine/threonine-protein kinase 8-like n=1 Tax=Salvia splendens TaxID=180675 RepID=UPI001C269004|nr:CBL-interacting serine/threonine-protein kinase 8-like [Salvia splendens]